MVKEFIPTQLTAEVGVLKIEGVEYRCMRCHSTFQLNAIPFCKFVVIPNEGELYDDLYTKLDGHVPGAELELKCKFSGKFIHDPSMSLGDEQVLRENEIQIFKGRFVGWSPVNSGTLLEVTVWALHSLTMLDWSSNLVDEVHGTSLGDPKLKMTIKAGESIVPYMMEPYSEGDASDIWANIIKKELLKFADFKRFAQKNDTAKEMLEQDDLSSTELPLNLTLENKKRAVIDIRRTLMTPGTETTLWDKLVYLASKYQFAVSPRIDGFSVIPFTALLKYKPERLLLAQEFITENNFMAYAGRYFDAMESIEDHESYSNPFDVVGRKPKPDKLRKRLTFGKEYYATGLFRAALWAQVGLDLSYETKRTTGLDGSIVAVGYSTSAGSGDAGNTPNTQYNEGSGDSEKFAKALLNDQLFKQRTAYLKTGVRFDLAPGSLVAVISTRSQKDDISYYGTVHTVCTSISGGKGYAGTWVILSNVRTKAEHEALEDSVHPLYNNKWVSAPILDPAKNGLSQHVPAFVGG